MSEHSPLPWQPNAILPRLIECADGLVAMTEVSPSGPIDVTNAEFICRAVNHFEALLKIAEQHLEFCSVCNDEAFPCEMCCHVAATITNAKAVR